MITFDFDLSLFLPPDSPKTRMLGDPVPNAPADMIFPDGEEAAVWYEDPVCWLL